MQRGRSGGTRVLDVDHRDALEAHRAKRHLTGHDNLALQHALARVAKIRSLDIAELGSGIGEGLGHRVPGEVLDRGLGPNAEGGHADSGDPHLRIGHATVSSVTRANP
jgi:hypothetical protein